MHLGSKIYCAEASEAETSGADVVEDVVEINNDYYKQDDCVYSDKLSEDLLMEEAVYSEYYESYIPSCYAIEINNDWILEEDLEEYKVEMGIEEYETTN